MMMRRLVLTLFLVGFGLAAASMSAQPALAATLCVGPGPGCYATIQEALNAAHDGDTITVGVSTFAGGITIEKSVRLVGAGVGATTIQGGGPAITIGSDLSHPTVSISGVTVTGGRNESSPGPSFAAGGGVQIAAGANVTIADSSVSGN